MYIYIYIHTYIYFIFLMYTYSYIYMYMYIYICICIYIYMHIHVYTCIHIFTLPGYIFDNTIYSLYPLLISSMMFRCTGVLLCRTVLACCDLD